MFGFLNLPVPHSIFSAALWICCAVTSISAASSVGSLTSILTSMPNSLLIRFCIRFLYLCFLPFGLVDCLSMWQQKCWNTTSPRSTTLSRMASTNKFSGVSSDGFRPFTMCSILLPSTRSGLKPRFSSSLFHRASFVGKKTSKSSRKAHLNLRVKSISIGSLLSQSGWSHDAFIFAYTMIRSWPQTVCCSRLTSILAWSRVTA
mmetsp:Transcript_117530/g.379281  ORF Transcript_117530/g.379281 Transcript_117530/m.379281 type:complete len:203 (+) Transcript_117530:140-748(+)